MAEHLKRLFVKPTPEMESEALGFLLNSDDVDWDMPLRLPDGTELWFTEDWIRAVYEHGTSKPPK